MKVLYLIETLGVGGAEQSLLQILPRLRSVDPVMCHIYEGAYLKSAYQEAGVPVVSLDLPPKYHFRTAIRRVEELAQAERPALIVTSLFRADVVGRTVGRRLGIPVIGSFVSECYAEIRWKSLSPAGRLKLKGVQLLDRFTARWATHFVANSGAVRDSEAHSLRVPRERVTVIHRGRDPEEFSVTLSAPERAAYRASLELPPEGPIVLNVGRLVDSKAQDELIAAFRRVADVFPRAMLLIAGEGPYQQTLEERTRSLGLTGSVRLLGQRDDIPRLLALADVFAFPSHYEGHPGALVEAMLAGKPSVVSDIPVHRETITPGESGLVVPVRSPEAFSEALLSLLQDPDRAGEMGCRARVTARRRFHIETVVRQHEALYQRVVRDHAARAAPGRVGVDRMESRNGSGEPPTRAIGDEEASTALRI
ncbi:MAG TPA: glycosyltransferase [Longimicrobiaceae bacterium]|nr:glycosyltransferase [Longimicrobiaceae bacterium]